MMETGAATGGEYKVRRHRERRAVDVVSATREEEFEVRGDLLTDVGGTLPAKVLSTPGMISVIEWTCQRLARDHLPEGQATVGFEVCIKHVAGAPEGARCISRATLREIVDGRKLRFDVEVLDGDRTIGVGTHERRALQA
jgi:fluoroacetyl-CoA thioesterase